MFLSRDLMTPRRTKSISNRDTVFSSLGIQSEASKDENEMKIREEQDVLAKKVETFISVNKKHQFDEVCVCEDCIYFKQIQKYESLKMDLSKNSSYRAQYNKNNLKKNHKKIEELNESSFTVRPQDSNMAKNPYVHLDSVYRNEYASRSLEKVEKPHPSDELKFTGPSSVMSSYKQMYPNLNGISQYVSLTFEKEVEPLRQEHIPLPSRKFKAESLYSNDFKGTSTVETESGKMNDQLRLGKPSMVKESTQRSQYTNPENYGMKNERYNSIGDKRIEAPNFSYQYSNFHFIKETINQDEFEKPSSKKNCRGKRLQVLHGQLLTSSNFPTIV